MNTQTQTTTLTTDTGTLRAILTALDAYTSPDKTRLALTLARVTPTADALTWEATNSTELVEITDRGTEHTLTAPALIDPAAILAAMPKKTDTKHHAETVLTLTPEAWQLTTGNTTSSGPAAPECQWPNTYALWQDQHPALAPHLIGAPMLARLAKLAKHLGTEYVEAATMAHTDDQPDPRRPLVYLIERQDLSARVLIMPRRRN